jgi:hypothetical protein
MSKTSEALRAQLFVDPNLNVYAILDGASVAGLLGKLYSPDAPEHHCLLSGELEPDLAEAAPYLVRLEKEGAFTDWLLSHGWGAHWGVYCGAAADLNTVRRHLRSLLRVRSPEGQPLFFRYYDPRVLRVYLPTCDSLEMDTFFGPLSWYLCEQEDPDEAILFRRGVEGPESQTLTIGG